MNSKPTLDGDRGFNGVEMRLDPAVLDPGMVSFARNCRFRKGKAETRGGIVKLKWTNHVGTVWPLLFPVDWDALLPFVTVYGAGRFEDPSGVDWIFIAGERIAGTGKIWVTRPNNMLIEEPLPAGENITADCKFVQAFDKLFLFRGEDAAPLVLEHPGTGEGFRALEEPEAGTATVKIPNAATALWTHNRLLIPHGRDLVAGSDYLNPERYASATMDFRVNQGSSDRLVGIYKLNEDTIVCAKESSLYVISNLVADTGTGGRWLTARVDELTPSFGFIASKSVVNVGADLIGLSQEGVMSVRQTELGRAQGVQLPMSAPIQAVIDRINWRYASGAVGAYSDSRYYLAVPLDDALVVGSELIPPALEYLPAFGETPLGGFVNSRTYRIEFGANDVALRVTDEAGRDQEFAKADSEVQEFTATGAGTMVWIRGVSGEEVALVIHEIFKGVNNAVLVFDFVTGAWCGYDDGAAVMVKEFVKLDYQGRERLFFMSADGFLNLYEEGFSDDVYEWEAWESVIVEEYEPVNGVFARDIEFEMLTRGYGTRALQNDGMSIAEMGEVKAEGVTIAMTTWNPKFTISEKPDGVNEEVAWREEIEKSRVRYDEMGVADWDPTNVNDDHGTANREDYSVTFDVEGGVLLGSGMNVEAHQDSIERLRLHGRGSSVQVRILNEQGRVELKRVEMVSGSGAGRRRVGAMI